ncbi:MAG: AAA family ATPase [Sedimentisphaerales bacterium]
MIFIKKLIIQNYKCFEDTPINFHIPDGTNEGSGLNILIGENGTGKTTILEAINYLTSSSFSAENKLSINDFYDYQKEIVIQAETDTFDCKSTIDFYKDWYFKAGGFIFSAKNRCSKARGKLLSPPFEIHNYFRTAEKYIKKDSSEGKEIDSRDKIFNNGNINDDEINVFYFDKNRTRQITTGNYKTTFEKICDDLNWKFIKGIDDEKKNKLQQNICGEYFKNVIEIAQKGTGKKVASEFKDFFGNADYENLKIEFLNLLHPFSNAFFAIRKENALQQINVRDLGSGVEIILTLLLLRSIANESKGSIIYLIDEPELHLHPKAQEKLLELLIKESKDKQIFLSTHSPYIFKNCLAHNVGLLIFNRDANNKVTISNARDKSWGLFPWSPSWGEINFYAYDLATIEFHNELYGHIQDREEKYREDDMESFLASKSIAKSKKWIKVSGGSPQSPYGVTICTYIRNKIHHSENTNNIDFTTSELRDSINKMIGLIK